MNTQPGQWDTWLFKNDSVLFAAGGKSSSGAILPFEPYPLCPHITLNT